MTFGRCQIDLRCVAIDAAHREAPPTLAITDNQHSTFQRRTPSRSSAAEALHSTATDSTIRVDVALLDKLMTRVGELVLARNQILQFTSALGDSDLLNASQRLNLITTELQEGVMKTRMQPIGNVWSKFPRLVRDLAAICGKEVRIEMDGKETELDKTIIEAIKDPLTHLVRNTVDHGIETPDVRVQKENLWKGACTCEPIMKEGRSTSKFLTTGWAESRADSCQSGRERAHHSRASQRLPDREVVN